MEKVINESECSGCLACIAFCPQKAIEKSHTEEGFYYPKIRYDLCNDCKLCSDFCRRLTDLKINKPLNIYSLQNRDEKMLIEATSGGAFELFAKKILSEGGVIFGAVYDENMIVKHKAGYSTEDIRKMNGSKYVQSDPIEAYMEALSALKRGQKVLFSGTPCQIAGLLALTGAYSNLITVDIPCYGVPSPEFFAWQVTNLEHKYKAQMTDFRFRDKHKNGFSHTSVLKFRRNETAFEKIVDKYIYIPYHYAFAQKNCYQKKCYRCEYTTPDRVSDITIASFWNIDKYTDMYDIEKGVSMVLVNTPKGRHLFDCISTNAVFKEHSLDDALVVNAALRKNVEYPRDRDRIINAGIKEGFNGIKRYYKPPLKEKIKGFMPMFAMNFLRRILRK